MLRFDALRRALLVIALLLLPATEADAAVPACRGRNLVTEMRENAPNDYLLLQIKAAAIANGEGLLWRVEKGGVAPSHLFGTIHITDERVTGLPAPVRDALAAAKTLAVESVDAMDRKVLEENLEAYKELMFFQDGRPLSEHLDEDRRAALMAALGRLGADIGEFGAMKPWVVATALAAPACETARQAELPVVDQIVANMAEAAGIPIVSLERIDEQLAAFDAIPLDLQAEYLIASVRLHPRMEDLFTTMAALYAARDVATIEALSKHLSDQTGISEAGHAAFNDHLVDRRNTVMIDRARPLIDKGAAFIAVGALHLPGDKGLVSLLREKGYTVTRIY